MSAHQAMHVRHQRLRNAARLVATAPGSRNVKVSLTMPAGYRVAATAFDNRAGGRKDSSGNSPRIASGVYHLTSVTRPFASNRIDRESPYSHVSMSPFPYRSRVVSCGSPQMALTSFVVIPTRGIVAAGRAGTRDFAALGAGVAPAFEPGAVAGIAPSESNSQGKFW